MTGYMGNSVNAPKVLEKIKLVCTDLMAETASDALAVPITDSWEKLGIEVGNAHQIHLWWAFRHGHLLSGVVPRESMSVGRSP